MSLEREKERCDNCLFFNKFDGGNTCKRYPPVPYPVPSQDALGQPVMSVICIEPQIVPENYCGEFKEKEPLLKPVP